jgi:hypothetical protein
MTTTLARERLVPGLTEGKKVTTTEFLLALAKWIDAAAENDLRRARLRLSSNGVGVESSLVSGVVRYAEGELSLSRENSAQYKGHTLVGKVALFDSNERWGQQTPGGNDEFAISPILSFPFDPNKKEQLAVKIRVGSGQVMLDANTLKGSISHLACESGLLFGFEDSGGLLPLALRRYYVLCLTALD